MKQDHGIKQSKVRPDAPRTNFPRHENRLFFSSCKDVGRGGRVLETKSTPSSIKGRRRNPMQAHETDAVFVADDNYLSHVLRTLEHVQNEKRAGGGIAKEPNARSVSLQNLYEDAVQLLRVATEDPLSTGSVNPANPLIMMKRCAKTPMGCGQVKPVTQFAKRISGPSVPFHIPSARDYSILCGECLAHSDRGSTGVLWEVVAEAVNQARKVREQMPDIDPLTMGVPGVNAALVMWQRNGGLCAICRDPLPGWATKTEREPSSFTYVEWIDRDKPPPSAWGAQMSERWSPPELVLHSSKQWFWVHSCCVHPHPCKEKLKETSDRPFIPFISARYLTDRRDRG